MMYSLEGGDGFLYASLHRGMELFCNDCNLYVGVIVEKPMKDLVHFSVNFLVDRDIVYLQNNENVTAVVEPDSHGQHFIIDLRELEYDSNLYIGIQKLNEYDTTLTLDVSLTVWIYLFFSLIVIRRWRMGYCEICRDSRSRSSRMGYFSY